MADGRVVNSSRNLVLLMCLYITLATLLVADRLLVNKRKYLSVFYVSEVNIRETTPIFAEYTKNRSTSALKSFSLSTKITLGVRLIVKTQIMAMLILLSNDIETQPGPALQANMYESLPKMRGFKVGHLNTRSIRNKMDDVRLLLIQNKFDVLTISESWLNSPVIDSVVSIPGYDVIRQDREQYKRGGGTMFYIRNGVPYKHRIDIITRTIESCWVEICKPKAKPILIGCVYRAPDVSLDGSIDELKESILGIPTNYEILLMGDFNVDYLASNKTQQTCRQRRKLKNFAIVNDLEQLITIPTRVTESSKSAIDLLFVNNNHRIVSCGTIISSISDHFIIFCVIKSGVLKAIPKVLNYRCYKTYDKNAFVNDLRDVDWNQITDTSDCIDDAVDKFSNIFNTIADHHAPFKTMRVKGIQVPWLNNKLRKAMRDRDCSHRRAVKTKQIADWNQYKSQKIFAKNEMKRSKAEYYKQLIDKNRGLPEKLWKNINEVIGRNTKLTPSCIASNGVVIRMHRR